MPVRIIAYVITVIVAAIGSTVFLSSLGPTLDFDLAIGALAFSSIGLIAQAVAHTTKGGVSRGSIAFVPFLTGLVLYPSWLIVVFISLAVFAGEMTQKKSWIKRFFNAAQYTLAASVAGIVYLKLGGQPLLVNDAFGPVAHSAAVILFMLLNSLLVAGAVALSSDRAVLEVWKQSGRGTFVYDLFAIPLVYWCALFYLKLGWAGIAFGLVALIGARQLYMKNRQLETAYEETLEILVGAVELRDPYTSGHSHRVRKYSQIIAQAIGSSPKEVERIGRAALLHDVGKIDEMFAQILNKPGRLTEEERAIMELHPLKSADLISKASQLADIVDIVKHHHERWDGTGYPSKLSGQEIPLGSRIITFADTIDAMTSDRPYRKALGEADVRAELIKHRGRQFDPEICDLLIASSQFARIFDSTDSGRVQSLTQVFDRVRKKQPNRAVA